MEANIGQKSLARGLSRPECLLSAWPVEFQKQKMLTRPKARTAQYASITKIQALFYHVAFTSTELCGQDL